MYTLALLADNVITKYEQSASKKARVYLHLPCLLLCNGVKRHNEQARDFQKWGQINCVEEPFIKIESVDGIYCANHNNLKGFEHL